MLQRLALFVRSELLSKEIWVRISDIDGSVGKQTKWNLWKKDARVEGKKVRWGGAL
jgi:hypothetical protein